ncbi:hypothetical protein MAPG_11902 [Magnaporthiopsis poae ATCC 64411]|uniref:Endoprotease n=1 Tax=Magnaporthiopsis poae (strain ATCC 64411 / 73-15) TaxID=644358 RepID=A0A0C4EGG3_MAGP6|nr:hypothetical protein MAPG_11902 [Magnaporthiopsis poae ATCC 64411]
MKSGSALCLLLALAGQGAMAARRGFIPVHRPSSVYDEGMAQTHGEVEESRLDRRAAKRTFKYDFFDQLLDHSNPSLGTFKQRYWYDTTHYNGPGSPVVVFNNGEAAGDGYEALLTNRTIPGMISQAVGGANILLEHRYFGKSSHFDQLTVRNLQYLTLNNSIVDNTYFARNVKLSFDPEGKSAPSKAPWVLSGASFGGTLAAYVERLYPGTFWAYYASSAPVETVADFWRYFGPIQEGMPRNCSVDVRRVIERVDNVLLTGSPQEKLALKTKFGFAALEHDADFGNALASVIRWQSMYPSKGYSAFYEWCDYVENAIPSVFPNASKPTAEGVGLEKALEGYAKYTREIVAPGSCDAATYGNNSLACWNSFNATDVVYTNTSLRGPANRQWEWFLCNEPFKNWETGAPKDQPTIVSRLMDVTYSQLLCNFTFPAEVVDGKTYTYGIAQGLDVDRVNSFAKGGWLYTNTTRLLQVFGEFDPWRELGVASVHRPGGELQSTDEHPILIMKGCIHTSDLYLDDALVNEEVASAQVKGVAIMKKWIEEFPGYKKA